MRCGVTTLFGLKLSLRSKVTLFVIVLEGPVVPWVGCTTLEAGCVGEIAGNWLSHSTIQKQEVNRYRAFLKIWKKK